MRTMPGKAKTVKEAKRSRKKTGKAEVKSKRSKGTGESEEGSKGAAKTEVGAKRCREGQSETEVRSKRSRKGQDKADTGSERIPEEADKTFTVNTDLKQLFASTSEQGSEGFSFLASEEKAQDASERPSPNQDEQQGEGEILADTATATTEENAHEHTSKFFFFHSGNADLENRLDENSFHRTQTWEELESEWPSRRDSMKQSFRRRHRDALKLGRKKKWTTARN